MSGTIYAPRRFTDNSELPVFLDHSSSTASAAAYTAFADPDFNAHEYVHRVLAGPDSNAKGAKTKSLTPAQSSTFLGDGALAKEDIGLAISKLNFGVEDVSKQIKNVITDNYEQLLERASSVSDLDDSVKSIRSGLSELDSSLEKLRQKVRQPYQQLSKQVLQLQRLQQASDALRRTSRFILLARRLEYQMAVASGSTGVNGPPGSSASTSSIVIASSSGSTVGGGDDTEREGMFSKAALSISELESLLESEDKDEEENSDEDVDDEEEEESRPIPLRHINVVTNCIPTIETARKKVTAEMESMVSSGLAELNQSRLASSLQTAHNLRVLPTLVQSLVLDLTDAVTTRIKSAFDMTKISKEAQSKEPASAQPSILYKSRQRTEPTNVTAPQWSNALWSRLELLIEELAGCCIKVYTLERVLKVKKDTTTQVSFLELAMEKLEDKPSTAFWGVLARTLEKQSRDAVRGSTFLQQTLSQGYPRLLRLFHDFFAKIGVHTDTVYTESQQSTETILVLRSLSPFEKLYLSRSTNKLNETVAQSFAGGTRSPPSMGEGLALGRTITNELDSARFDPLLVSTVAKTVATVLDTFITRINGMVVKDRAATTLVSSVVTPQQVLNAQLATTLWHCWSKLKGLQDEYPERVSSIIVPTIKKLHLSFAQITDPLLVGIRRDLAAIIARLQRLDLSKDFDEVVMGAPSTYMKELSERLAFVRSEILSKINAGENSREWLLSVARHVIQTFAMHVSIAKPLGESGKLQLTRDMTELEFAISAFIADNAQSKSGLKLDNLGDTFRTLRSMRPLLFLENDKLADSKSTAGVPPLVVLHHILVRSPLQLPHRLHGWQEAEYVAWLDDHTTDEALTLVDGDLTHWEQLHDAKVTADSVYDEAVEYVKLARNVLQNANH